MADVERINKETGELSASGELAAPLDLKEGGVGRRGGGPQPHPLLVLQEMLQQMETHTHKDSMNTSGQKHTHLSPDHTHTQKETMDQSEIDTPLPLDQKEEHLLRVLPLYIQVQYCGISGPICVCAILPTSVVIVMPNSHRSWPYVTNRCGSRLGIPLLSFSLTIGNGHY